MPFEYFEDIPVPFRVLSQNVVQLPYLGACIKSENNRYQFFTPILAIV